MTVEDQRKTRILEGNAMIMLPLNDLNTWLGYFITKTPQGKPLQFSLSARQSLKAPTQHHCCISTLRFWDITIHDQQNNERFEIEQVQGTDIGDAIDLNAEWDDSVIETKQKEVPVRFEFSTTRVKVDGDANGDSGKYFGSGKECIICCGPMTMTRAIDF